MSDNEPIIFDEILDIYNYKRTDMEKEAFILGFFMGKTMQPVILRPG